MPVEAQLIARAIRTVVSWPRGSIGHQDGLTASEPTLIPACHSSMSILPTLPNYVVNKMINTYPRLMQSSVVGCVEA